MCPRCRSRSVLCAVLVALFVPFVESQLQAPAPPVVVPQGPKLVVLMFSGFRWDFLNFTNNGFRLLDAEGVRAYYMTPVFPSLSYPNVYSLLTGLHTENHGIIGDYMYNSRKDEFFLGYPADYNTRNPSWWEQAEPFWIRAARSGLRTELHWWPGCDTPIFGIRPDVCVPYRNSGPKVPQLAQKLEALINNIATGLANVAFVYVDDVIQMARVYGPTARETIQVVQAIDFALRGFQEQLRVRNLHNDINVIVASDHGVSQVNPLNQARTIDLQGFIPDARDIDKIIDIGAVVGVFPADGKNEIVYQTLRQRFVPGMNVYRNYDVPEHYFYKRSEYVPPVVVVADPGITITWGGDRSKLVSAKDPFWIGVNGYDPYVTTDMRGIFLARGPDFRRNYRSSAIEIVDVYNLMCAVTGITPHRNQGQWHNVRDMLTQPPAAHFLYASAYSNDASRKTGLSVIPLALSLILARFLTSCIS